MVKKTKVVMLMCIAVFLAALMCAGAASATTVTVNSEADLRTQLTTTSNYVELGTDLTLTTTHIEINTTSPTLDLKGHSLKAAPNQRIFYLNGADVNFTLTDTSADKTGKLVGNGALSAISGYEYLYQSGGGVYLHLGKFNMIDCKIIDCAVTNYGGAVWVYAGDGDSQCTMTMINSQIDNCSAGTFGGGLCIGTKLNSFVMTDSTISNCTANHGGAISSTGSASTSIFTMNNCRIYDCMAYHGGAIYISECENSFTMNHSIINNCTSTVSTLGGGGVYLKGYNPSTWVSYPSPIFTMNGGSSITNCRASNYCGGGVYLGGNCKFNLSNGSITGCSDKNGLNCVYNDKSDFIVSDATAQLDGVNLSCEYNSGVGSYFYGTITIHDSIKSEFAGYVHNITVNQIAQYRDSKTAVVKNGMAVADPLGQFTLSAYTHHPSTVSYLYLAPSSNNKDLVITNTPTYRVIVYTDGRGTASANRTTCPENGVVDLTAYPDSGFQFGYWEDTTTKAHLSTSNPYLITMSNQDLNVTAHFIGTQFNVTVHSVGNGTVSTDKEQYEKNDVVTLIPSPEPGYKFSKWESPNVTAFSGNTFIMPAEDVDVTAYFSKDTTGVGAGEYILTGLGEGAANVKVYYDEPRKTLFVENTSPIDSSGGSSLGDGVLTITQFGFSDSAVTMIEVDYDVSLGNNPNVFSNFVNAGLNYMGESIPYGANVGGKPLYRVNATNSTVYIEAKQSYTGKALTVDTNWAVKGQEVRLAVKPLQNYSVYGWTIYTDGIPRDDSSIIISPSTDPENPGLFVLTMPGSDVTVEPKLRDQGSTFVTYIFLDADTYVMEIPADFSLTGINKTVEGKEVNITACDLFEGHNLKVTMASANGYDGSGFFKLLSVKDRSAQATYAIGEKDIYLGSSKVEPVQEENKVVLDTSQIIGSSLPGSSVIDDLVAEGNLKTELQFTLKQMLKPDVIGKYKDKLTFTVEITTA